MCGLFFVSIDFDLMQCIIIEIVAKTESIVGLGKMFIMSHR